MTELHDSVFFYYLKYFLLILHMCDRTFYNLLSPSFCSFTSCCHSLALHLSLLDVGLLDPKQQDIIWTNLVPRPQKHKVSTLENLWISQQTMEKQPATWGRNSKPFLQSGLDPGLLNILSLWLV